MKQHLLFSTFILCVLMSFSAHSQYKVDEQRIYSWDDFTPDWEHNMTMEFTYDNEGDKETNLLYLAMPGSEKQIQYVKHYNASNLVKLQVTQFWEPSTMVWQDISKTDYDYSNNLITETTQIYNLSTMVYTNSNRTVNLYSGANLMTKTNQNWDYGLGIWVNSSRDLFEYSGSDITLHTEQKWNAGTIEWVNEEETEITYVSAGKPNQTIIKQWNSGTGVWDLDERVTYTYTMDLISEAVGDDYIGGQWVLDHRTELTYENGLATVILYQERAGGAWVNMDRILNTYDANGNNTVNITEEWDILETEWIPEGKIEREFSLVLPFSLSTASFNTEEFVVYPNPASDVINVSYFLPIEKMELYDILGNKVASSSNAKHLNIESLKSGMYVLKVFDKNSSTTKKIIIN